jgi:hypothetical protein
MGSRMADGESKLQPIVSEETGPLDSKIFSWKSSRSIVSEKFVIACLYLSTFVSFVPIWEAMITNVVEMKIIRIPKAESLPHRPSSANRRI